MNKYRLSDKVRLFHYEEDGIKHSVNLRQIVALRDFADVPAGSEGGWLDDESALSQAGTCWIYDPNSAVFAGARIEGNARLTGPASSATSLSSATMHGSTAVPSAITPLSVTTSRFRTPAFAASAASPTGRAFSPLPDYRRPGADRRPRQISANLPAGDGQRFAHRSSGADLR
jgi:hypothetical protein